MQNNNLQDIFSLNEINGLLTNLEIRSNKEKLSETQKVVKFSIPLSDDIKVILEEKLWLDLSRVTSIPMRWIRGDTPPHIDRGESYFAATYLIYLTDSVGELVVDGVQYSIAAGNAHIFSEGLGHSTLNTENTDRLMIGPMSETGFPVGAAGITYFPNSINNDCAMYQYGGGDTQILNIPPPVPTENYYNNSGIEDSVIWASPPGKVFGGWKLLDNGNSWPIGENTREKLYFPGEQYNFIQYYSTLLVPNWIDTIRPDIRMHFTDNSRVVRCWYSKK